MEYKGGFGMKKLTNEMIFYLALGMKEEMEKDTDTDNEVVRWNKGMKHETIKNVGKWQSYYNANDEENADFFYEVLQGHLQWWKNYFDESPEYAREVEEKKRDGAKIEYIKSKYKTDENIIRQFMSFKGE